MKNYFPATLERLPWVELDPKKNYLFCCFPHGMLSLGVFCSFGKYFFLIIGRKIVKKNSFYENIVLPVKRSQIISKLYIFIIIYIFYLYFFKSTVCFFFWCRLIVLVKNILSLKHMFVICLSYSLNISMTHIFLDLPCR